MISIMTKLMSVLLSIILLSGCSLFSSSKQDLTVMSNVPDAEIFINGQRVGVGNIETRVKKNKNVQVMARREGYYPAYYNVDTRWSTTGTLDLIGGFLLIVPFLGLLSPASHKLDSSNVAVELVENKKL